MNEVYVVLWSHAKHEADFIQVDTFLTVCSTLDYAKSCAEIYFGNLIGTVTWVKVDDNPRTYTGWAKWESGAYVSFLISRYPVDCFVRELKGL